MNSKYAKLVGILAGSAALLGAASLGALTVEIPGGGTDYVQPGDSWRLFRARTAPSNPAAAWKEIDFLDSGWELRPGGFGYGYTAGIGTPLTDMRNGYISVFIRREFTISGPVEDAELFLEIDYDDGFVAYLNGNLAAWRSMPLDPATQTIDYSTPAVSHNAGSPERIALGNASAVLRQGKNVLAIEGHNVSLGGSSDFALIAGLRTAASIVKDGERWVVEAASQELRGSTADPQAAAVEINGAPADFDLAARTWQGAVALSPGLNHVVVEALDAGSTVVESGAADILYIPASQRFSGALGGDAVWSTAAAGIIAGGTLVVPAGATLRIEPGVTVYLENGAGIEVRGRLLAEGTEAQPIRLTRYGDGARWDRIIFIQAQDSRLAHCTIEYADSEGAHQDYYLPGPRNYHEAIVALASHLDFEDCLFQKLPDESAGAEGDAIAIISDDPDYPGNASAAVQRCRFISIGQGVHTRFSYVRVEDCFFTGKRGDNDDVDLWGESDPPPLVLHSIFVDPEHDDAINPTRCSAVIIGNFISGTDDHGIVLRDKGFPIVINNVITRCANAGIAVENSCNALLINNTITDSGRGLRLFDLGRWDSPYFLAPGGGTATVINCLIRDCPQPVTMEDSSNTTIPDRGSHITVLYSNIQRGQSGISVSGAQSTVSWGAGNIDADPRFADAANGDFHLLAGSPAIDSGTAAHESIPSTDRDGNPRPCGAGIDMGAYETGGCGPPGPALFRRGFANSDSDIDISDAVFILLYIFAGGAAPTCEQSLDVDDNGLIEITDPIHLLDYLFLHGPAPAGPFQACGPDATPDQAPLSCNSLPACR